MSDFVDIIEKLTGFIQNERVAAYNEGMEVALKAVRDFIRAELRIDPSSSGSVPDLLYEIKEHYDALTIPPSDVESQSEKHRDSPA